jgi:multidrug efflux pump subunit AcrB
MEEPASPRFSISTRRPVAILMVVMAVCVFGWVSYQRLTLNLMPEISYPTLTVRTEFPGTAPEEIETLVSRPLEQTLGVVRHLVSISSISKADQSDVILEFNWETDMDAASQDIREKIDRVNLPLDVAKPLLLRYDPSLDPFMRIGLFGEHTLYDLRFLAENEIKRELERVPGIAAVKVKGGLEEEIHVALNERQLALIGLDIAEVIRRLEQGNVNLPGGRLREGQVEYLIRTLNEFTSLEDIANLVVARHDEADIRLRDVAKIDRSYRDREVITRVNGRESVELELFKEADANVVTVSRRVHDRIYGLAEQRQYIKKLAEEATKEVGEPEEESEEEKPAEEAKNLKEKKREAAIRTMEHLRLTDFINHQLPADMQLEILSDQSVFIVNSINEVQKSALIGGAMAILVLFLFLRNVVHTIIVGITIPISIVATFAPMHIFDVSLNIMSLGGLALGIGMLVDNSIVVLESIFRCREEGDDLVTATIRGTGEVGSAVFASTLTTVAVFFPIVFVEGIAGQVFGDMALTVVFSLTASLAVALFFIPMLASRRIKDADSPDSSGLQRTDFLKLKSMERARSALADTDEGLLVRLVRGAGSVPYLLYELVWRTLLAAVTIVVAVLKAVAMVLFELVWCLAKPVEKLWIKPDRTFQVTAVLWCESSKLGRWSFFDQMWPDILTMGAASSLSNSMQAYCRWISGPRWLGVVVRAITFPFALIYLLVRFIFQTVVRLIGIVSMAVILVVALVLLSIFFLAGLLLLPLMTPILIVFEFLFDKIQRAYPPLLRWALRRRLLVVVAAIACFALCYFEAVPRLGSELIPQVHQGEFNLEVALPVGSPLNKTAEVIAKIEAVVVEQPEVMRVTTTVGADRTATTKAEEGEHSGKLTLRLNEGSNAHQEQDLIQRLRTLLRDLPETDMEVSHPALFSFKTPIELEIRGHDLHVLRRLSQQAVEMLAALPGIVDVKSSLKSGNPELQLTYNRERLAGYGLNMRTVAELVRNKVQGKIATEFREEERQVRILVRLQEKDRLGIAELNRLVVNPDGEVPIPLGAIADISVSEGPSEIRRIDQQRAALITANIRDIDLGTASQNIVAALRRSIDFPLGFSYLISGQNREMETSLDSLFVALGLAIFLVYIVMASQFESLIHPFVIMFTVPLAGVGVVAVLFFADIALSIVVFLGLIMLAGIVVNNAIVLVDYINTLKQSGLEHMEAIVQAGTVRLRPICMTTLTTVLALLPMALGLGEGAEIRTPMALTVIAGLTSSTFLTLIVIPTVYSLVDRRR